MPADTPEKFRDMIILANQGPWGSHDGGDGQDGGHGGGNEPPWTPPPRRGGGGNQPPDLDEMLRQAQNRFKNKFGGTVHGGGGNGRTIGFLLLLVLLLWLGSGFYLIQPQENAAVLTFGKLTAIRKDPGLSYHLPYPVQDVEKRDVKKNNQMDIGFTQSGSAGPVVDRPEQSMMLTSDPSGDPNIVKVHFVVIWHIGDLGKYLFEIGDPEGTLQKVSESAMREIMGRTPIQKAMTDGRDEIQIDSQHLMQKMLDEYQSGIQIDSVQLQSVDPPDQVVDAFNDVQRARNDKERLKNEALSYSNDILPKAKGQAEKIIKDAEAYKESIIKKATGNADRFNLVYSAYAKSKDVTGERMYLDTMEDVLKKNRKVIVTGGDAKNIPLLPFMQIAPAAGGDMTDATAAGGTGADDGGGMPPQPGQ
jgi:membrane protease subunit HflK